VSLFAELSRDRAADRDKWS